VERGESALPRGENVHQTNERGFASRRRSKTRHAVCASLLKHGQADRRTVIQFWVSRRHWPARRRACHAQRARNGGGDGWCRTWLCFNAAEPECAPVPPLRPTLACFTWMAPVPQRPGAQRSPHQHRHCRQHQHHHHRFHPASVEWAHPWAPYPSDPSGPCPSPLAP